MQKTINYFDEKGVGNTDEVLLLARNRAKELGINTVIVASSEGNTAVRAMDFLGGFKVVVVGLAIANQLGFSTPILSAILVGQQYVDTEEIFMNGIGLGLICGVLVVMIMVVSKPFLSKKDFIFYDIALRKRLIAGIFHGGLTEELIFRLFLLSMFVWLFSFVEGVNMGAPSLHSLWLANILTAAFFAFAHLPATILLGKGNKLSIAMTLSLNGTLSLVFGYSFWNWGLESAMLTHASTHISLQILAAPFLKR